MGPVYIKNSCLVSSWTKRERPHGMLSVFTHFKIFKSAVPPSLIVWQVSCAAMTVHLSPAWFSPYPFALIVRLIPHFSSFNVSVIIVDYRLPSIFPQQYMQLKKFELFHYKFHRQGSSSLHSHSLHSVFPVRTFFLFLVFSRHSVFLFFPFFFFSFSFEFFFEVEDRVQCSSLSCWITCSYFTLIVFDHL